MRIEIEIPKGCYEELKEAKFPAQDTYRLIGWIKAGKIIDDESDNLVEIRTLKPGITIEMTKEEAKRILEFDLDHTHNDESKEALRVAIKALEQESKTGHWVKIVPYPLQILNYECSECAHETDDNTEKYCSECGARMIESPK